MPTTSVLPDSTADIIRWLLVNLGVGTNTSLNQAWPLYVSNEPTMPDNVITFHDTQGRSDGRSQIDGEIFTHYGFQAMIRSKDHPTGWTKGDQLLYYLSRVVLNNSVQHPVSLVNYHVVCVTHIGSVMSLGTDESSRRSLFSLNAACSLRRV